VKAIIVTDTECKALLDQLELTALKANNHWPNNSAGTIDEINQAHRAFHFIVTRWLQEMGADTLRGR
jgi:hypothetical protein